MIVEFETRLTVRELLAGFRRKYGTISRLRRRVLRKRVPGIESMDLEQWEACAARRADLDEEVRVRHGIILHGPGDFFEMFTPERVRLLQVLRSNSDVQSIRELAKLLRRDRKNVYRDVKTLKEYGFVSLRRRNARRVIPRARAGEITVTL